MGNPSSAQRLKIFKGGECTKFEELEPHERAAKHPREGQRPERPIPPARARLPFSQPQWPTRAGCQRLFTAPTTNSCVHVGQELVLEITCVSASCEELIDGWVEPFKRRLFRGKIFHPHSSNEVPVADRWS